MLANQAYDRHVLARLLDFFSEKTAWQRTLWNSGTVLSLQELLEASEQSARGVVSESSLGHFAHSISIAVLRDPGVGDQQRRKQISNLLKMDERKNTLAYLGVQYRSVKLVIPEVANGYLRRWSESLGLMPPPVKAERAARGVASHLLDCGFNSQYLHRWFTFKGRHEPGTKSLATILEEADDLAREPLRTFEALLIFTHAPATDPAKEQPVHWLTNKAASEWLRAQGFDVSGLRQRGGFRLSVTSRDLQGVADTAAETASRLISRINLGSSNYNRLALMDQVWVAGEPKPIPLPRLRRRVEVHSLQRENRLYDLREFGSIDAAMELVEPLDGQPPSAAVAGGWAAIEALLTGPGDRDQRVQAGDRMAALVACSFPRAELTTLSYELERQGGVLGEDLKNCQSNKARCEILVRLITAATPPVFQRDSDNAALSRISSLLSDPSRVMGDIETHIAACLRRLYRNRNIVLHGGKTNAVGLRACLRIAAPLVGAGLDRIAHAAYTESIHPLELAARARLRLDALVSQAAVHPLDLLS